jgi:hypothetical protein
MPGGFFCRVPGQRMATSTPTTDSVYAELCSQCATDNIPLPPQHIIHVIRSVIGSILDDEVTHLKNFEKEHYRRFQELDARHRELRARTDEQLVRSADEYERIIKRAEENLQQKQRKHFDEVAEKGAWEYSHIQEPELYEYIRYGLGRLVLGDGYREYWDARAKYRAQIDHAVNELKQKYPFKVDPDEDPELIKARYYEERQKKWDEPSTKMADAWAKHKAEESQITDLAGIERIIAFSFCSYLSFLQPYIKVQSGTKVLLTDIIDEHPGKVLRIFFKNFQRENRFASMRDPLARNEQSLSRSISPNWYEEATSITFAEMIEIALRGTVLRSLFQVEVFMPDPTVPEIEESFWYSHALLLARTRLGKTNVIRWRIQQLIPQITQGRASVVLMEPKGVLTDEILHLANVWNMRDRPVILDPTDTRASVNVFSKGDGSDVAIQETIARVMRVLNTVTTTLTPFQQDALTFCLRAMFCVDAPGSMRLLTTILRRGLTGLPLRELPRTLEEYFVNDFKPGDTQAQQIITRLNGLLANPIFEALFDADHSTFDMFNEIQAGKLIIINASAADDLYARFWIEQVNSCIRPRFKVPLERRTPTTFIIDEAQTWIKEDLHFAEVLDKAAEARIGMLIAAHHMGQITSAEVRGSIYTNATLKFAANTSEDILALCRSMGRTTHDFVQTLPQYEFAYFGPSMTEAIKVKFPLVEFDKMPRMAESQYQQMRDENRRKYGYKRTSPDVGSIPIPPTAPRAAPTAPPSASLSPQPSPTPPQGPQTSSKDTW